MFHWLLVAPQALKSVLPVAGCFSDKEMCTFSRIRAHQSTSYTFNTSLWRRKAKPASVNFFAFVVWRRIRFVVHFHDKFLSFLCWGTSCFKNGFSSQCHKEPVSYFNQYSRIFSGRLNGQVSQRWISLPPVIASVILSILFFDDTSWRSSATALLVELGLFSSLRKSKPVTCSSIFCPLVAVVLNLFSITPP